MTDKPTNTMNAAEEIIDYLQASRETIEAIILKHCPDKAEKLVEALIEARVRLGYPLGTQPNESYGTGRSIKYPLVAATVQIIDNALADCEANK